MVLLLGDPNNQDVDINDLEWSVIDNVGGMVYAGIITWCEVHKKPCEISLKDATTLFLSDPTILVDLITKMNDGKAIERPILEAEKKDIAT